MNNPTFLRNLKSENIFKISDKLKTFDIHPIPAKRIVVTQYECKKTMKSTQAQTKIKTQEFSLITVCDQEYVFMELKETNTTRPSVFTLAEREFIESGFLETLVGQKKQVFSQQYQITGFEWDGFKIQFISFQEEIFLFIITNEMISTRVRSFEPIEVQKKIKQGFEEILSKIINQKKANELVDTYLDQLRKLFDKHPELLQNTYDTQKTINFHLIKYQKIAQISSLELKGKVDEQRKERSISQTEMEK